MYIIVEWFEVHKFYKRVFDTYKKAEDFAISLMQSKLNHNISISIIFKGGLKCLQQQQY